MVIFVVEARKRWVHSLRACYSHWNPISSESNSCVSYIEKQVGTDTGLLRVDAFVLTQQWRYWILVWTEMDRSLFFIRERQTAPPRKQVGKMWTCSAPIYCRCLAGIFIRAPGLICHRRNKLRFIDEYHVSAYFPTFYDYCLPRTYVLLRLLLLATNWTTIYLLIQAPLTKHQKTRGY